MRENINNLVDDFGIFGLLNSVFDSGVAGGKIDGKALQGGSEAKSEIASNAAGVDGLLMAFNGAMKIIKPLDTLIEIIDAELELI